MNFLRGSLTRYAHVETERLVGTVPVAQRPATAELLVSWVNSEMPEPCWTHDPRHSALPGVAIAAVGLLPSAAAVAELLERAELKQHWHLLPTGHLTKVAERRGIDWLPELASGLARRLPRHPDEAGWRGIADLIVATGAPVPTHDAFVHGWAAWLCCSIWDKHWPKTSSGRAAAMSNRLSKGPFLPVLLPRVFETDSIGSLLGQPDAEVARALTLLANDHVDHDRRNRQHDDRGPVDRAVLIDGCLARLARPDRHGSPLFFTRLHDQLCPTENEMAERAERYADIAVRGSSPSVSFALRHLRALLDAGRLDIDLLLRTAPAVLDRPGRGIVRSMIALLDLSLSESPERTDDVVLLLSRCFDSTVPGAAEKALGVVTRRGKVLKQSTRRTISQRPPSNPPPPTYVLPA